MALRRAYVDGPFGQLHYAEEGLGQPIVMVHMAGFNHIQYAAAMPLLAEAGFRAISLDLPGFGMSAPPSAPPSISDYADAVHALVAALALEPLIIVGSHLGAQIASEYAVKYPSAVKKLVLVGPLPTTAEEREANQAQVEAEKNVKVESNGRHLTDVWDYTLPFFQGLSDIRAFERLILSQLSAGDHAWYGHNAVFSYDHAATLARQSQPCLVLSNTGDVAHFFSGRTRDLFPQFAYKELEGGTALIVDEQPRAWTDAIIAFACGN